MLPLGWDERTRTLALAVGDPADETRLEEVKRAFDARRLKLTMAPENRLRELGRRLSGGSAGAPEYRIALPELFQGRDEGEPGSADAASGALPRLVMVAAGAPRRDFLPPLFRREGWDLTVVDGPEGLREALARGPVARVLVAEELAAEVKGWVGGGLVPPLPGGMGIFRSVSGALLENPVPYAAVSAALRRAVEALADARSSGGGGAAYGLMARDADELARSQGLGEVARDGLHLALHLLQPPSGARPPRDDEPFEGFHGSRELAVRLRFPWPVEGLLDLVQALFRGEALPGRVGAWGDELHRAAQVLALVWFHRVQLPGGGAGGTQAAVRSALRSRASRLATLELVESYLAILSERGDSGPLAGAGRQLLLVGPPGGLLEALGGRLGRLGAQVVATSDLRDAQAMAERRAPAAIVVEHDRFPGEASRFSRVAKLDRGVLLYMVTTSTDPSLTLELLDAGADDVFAPPHDMDLIAARMARAMTARSEGSRSSPEEKGGSFSASFAAFSFLDLVQTLGHALKSVRIDLLRGDGEQGVVFMERGRIVHAECGDLKGARAVYRIIAWEDDGAFTVHPETRMPQPTVQLALETLLMEGVRLLDESRV